MMSTTTPDNFPDQIRVRGLPFLLQGWNTVYYKTARMADGCPIYRLDEYVLYGLIGIIGVSIYRSDGIWHLVRADGMDICHTFAEYNEFYRRTLERVVNGAGPGTIGKIVPTPIEDAVPALQVLRDLVGIEFPMAVVSAHPQTMLVNDLNRYGLLGNEDEDDIFQQDMPVFDEIIGDCFNKADALTTFAKTHALDPKCVVYIGDSVGDVEAANRAGMTSVGITGGYHSAEMIQAAHPCHVFPNVAAFIDRFNVEFIRETC
jgi:phosphoglycolate phosphatase-like HAD superfamily hydrolase